jgi:hypothetical protein
MGQVQATQSSAPWQIRPSAKQAPGWNAFGSDRVAEEIGMRPGGGAGIRGQPN